MSTPAQKGVGTCLRTPMPDPERHPQGSVIYVNRAWRETLGYGEDEIPGLSLMDIIHPDSKAHCAETFQRVMAGEDIERVEAMFVAKDGRTITVKGTSIVDSRMASPLPPRGMFAPSPSASGPRRRCENQKRGTRRCSQAPHRECSWPTWKREIPTYANPAMCRMFGYTEEEFLRIGVADIHPKESLSYVMVEFETLAHGERSCQRDLPSPAQRRLAYSTSSVSATMVALGRRKLHACGLFHRRHRATRRRRRRCGNQKRGTRRCSQATPEGMLVADLQSGQFRHANPAMSQDVRIHRRRVLADRRRGTFTQRSP